MEGSSPGWLTVWESLCGRARDIGFPGEAGSLRWWALMWWRVTNKRWRVWWYLKRRIRSKGMSIQWIQNKSRKNQSRETSSPPLTFSFDSQIYNPIGWRRNVRKKVAALGPLRWLPSGVEAHRIIDSNDLPRLRRIHHVEDVEAFHADSVARAGTLIRLAATGTVVHLADGAPWLQAMLGDDLYASMTTDARNLDAGGRELLSIRMRRAALREHLVHPQSLPLVSILAATKRPKFLPSFLSFVTKQTYPRLELILALHGDSFGDFEQYVATVPYETKVLQIPSSEPLGAALNAAVTASSGTLLTKMDDDDIYGADHVWDLVLALGYSQAQLVGKGAEFVYLAAVNQTVHHLSGCGEDYRAMTLTGGTLLISRRELDRVGGWRPLPRRVDLGLIEDVLRARGGVYRTHGAGYILVRHGGDHTSDISDDYFLTRSDRVISGWNPALADIKQPNVPYAGLGHLENGVSRGCL